VGGSARWGLCPPDPLHSGGQAGPGRWTGRFCQVLRGQGWSLPHLPRRDEDRCSRPDVSCRGWLQGEGLPPALSSAHRPALIPFSGGDLALASHGICIYKTPLGRGPADGPNGGESGPMPPASRPRVRGRAAGEYVAALLPLLGQVGRSPMVKPTKKPAPPREIAALKETPGRGLIKDQYVWIRPNNGFTSGSLFCLDAGGLGGEGFSVASNGLAIHRRRTAARLGLFDGRRRLRPPPDPGSNTGRTAGCPLPRPGLALQVFLCTFPITVIGGRADSAV
jgi:hypothetical protein